MDWPAFLDAIPVKDFGSAIGDRDRCFAVLSFVHIF